MFEDTPTTITLTTTHDTALATCTAKDIFYNECTEQSSARSGRNSVHLWCVLPNATSGSVEIHQGTAGYEMFLAPGAVIQSRKMPDGVAVMFRPRDVITVVSLDDAPQELVPVYLAPTDQL
jgi:hypothetical protein